MSAFVRGIAVAIGMMLGGACGVALLVVVRGADFYLSDGALSAMAQIGATLLVAYAIEMSWFVKESRSRGRNRENWLGFVTGVGVCAVFGIAFSVFLVEQPGSPTFLEASAAVWAIFSLGLLAILVATLPYLLYELVHTIHTEHPDE